MRGGAVSGRTENGGVVLSPVTGEHQARADGWRRTDEGAFKRKGAGAKAATAAATATGGERRNAASWERRRKDEWSGEGRGEERRGETPASVEGSLASEAGVARTRWREGKRKDRERGGWGGREGAGERTRDTTPRES